LCLTEGAGRRNLRIFRATPQHRPYPGDLLRRGLFTHSLGNVHSASTYGQANGLRSMWRDRSLKKELASMREAYHEQIDHLTGRLVNMTEQVAGMIRDATNALLAADIHKADLVVESDAEVDRERTDIEEILLELIATQAPVARELRRIVASMRNTQELERMGDLAKHVAKIARMRYPESAVPPELRTTFTAMGVVAERMATKAGVLLRAPDAEAAERMRHEDDEMDRLYKGLFLVILDDDWPYPTETAVDQALLGRYYERFADHAVTIALQFTQRAST
jgi:phosphate transport system protein